jgi:hypothetical protein
MHLVQTVVNTMIAITFLLLSYCVCPSRERAVKASGTVTECIDSAFSYVPIDFKREGARLYRFPGTRIRID